jgi:hypothetical protein
MCRSTAAPTSPPSTSSVWTPEHAEGLIRMYTARGYRLVGHVDYRPKVNYRSVLLSRAL